MQNEPNIYYLYDDKREDFIEPLREIDMGVGITYQPFSIDSVFPSLDYESITHLVVTGSLAHIKQIFKIAKEHKISVGIVPLANQTKLTKIFDLPRTPKDALAQAIIPSQKNIDLLYCNDIIVLNDVRISEASILKEYTIDYRENHPIKKLKLFWKSLRKKGTLKHNRFMITTSKDEKIDISAVGLIGVGYHNLSWISNLIKSRLSAIDGQNALLILSPTSLFQYFVTSPLILFLQKWGSPKLPNTCGYIKSSRIKVESSKDTKVIIDDMKTISTPIVLQTEPDVLALSVGEKFWVEQKVTKSDKSSRRLDNIPKDEELITYLTKGLPLFTHASKEQYATLFSKLREESMLTSTFVVLLILATVIATFGLFINSSSVIIGAMILAPLMLPIVSLSMGVLRDDITLSQNSIKTIVMGILVTISTAMIIAYFAPLREMTSEMMARLSPTILDMFVAIASGVAAAYVKNDSKISASLAGVAIAVALVPPLAVSGVGAGWGDWSMFLNALLLFATNLVGIIFAGALTFLMMGFAPIKVAKRGIVIWAIISILIALPLYHSFVTMQEQSSIRKRLLHTVVEINSKKIYLSKIDYRLQGDKPLIRCEVIIDDKLTKEERVYLRSAISDIVGKPTEVIATFGYRLE